MAHMGRSLVSSTRKVSILNLLVAIIYLFFIIIIATGAGASQENETPKLVIEKTSIILSGQLTYTNFSSGERNITLSNAELSVIRDNLTSGKVWINLPVSSAMLTNATLQMDSNFSLQNCSIDLPELNISLKDKIKVNLELTQSRKIKGLNNKSLSLTGIELQINKTEISLLPGPLEIPEAWLIIPQDLPVKYINISTTGDNNNSNISIVNGTLSFNRTYINIRNSTLVLPPGSLINEESTFQQWNTSISKWDTGITTPLWAIIYYFTNNLLRIFVLIVGLIIAFVIFYRVIGYLLSHPTSVVLNSFGKTGYDNIDKNLEGLSQLAREYSGGKLEYIQEIVKKHSKDQELDKYKAREFCPLPSNLRKKDISDFISSMKDAKIDSIPQLQPIINLSAPIANFLFPPTGVEISSFLQSKGKDSETLGITFNLMDISGKQDPRSFTYWESQTEPQIKIMDPEHKKQGLKNLSEYFEKAGELQQAKKYQNELLGMYTEAEIIGNKNKYINLGKKISGLDLGYRLYSLGKEYEKKRDINKAIDHYLEALKEATEHPEINDQLRYKWMHIIENPIKDIEIYNKIRDCIYVANEYWNAGLQKIAIEILEEAEKLCPKYEKMAKNKLKGLKVLKVSSLNSAAKELLAMGRSNEAKVIVKLALELLPDDKDTLQLSKDASNAILEATLQDRCIKLLNPATFYLAAEIHRFWMLDQLLRHSYLKLGNHNDAHVEASVCNFFGALYISAGFHDNAWLDLAQKDLQKACTLYEDWYLPHENLGFLYAMRGQKEDKENGNEKKKWIHQAIVEYDKALTKINLPISFHEQRIISRNETIELIKDLWNGTEISKNDESDPEIIKKRINVENAIAYTYRGDIKKAKDIIEKIDTGLQLGTQATVLTTSSIIEDFLKEVPTLLRNLKSPRLIYNLACYYALVCESSEYSKDTKKIKNRSRLLLAISLAKDKANKDNNLWILVDIDPDLNNVRGGLPSLKFYLADEMAKHNDKLPKEKDISTLFREVFNKSEWISIQETTQ